MEEFQNWLSLNGITNKAYVYLVKRILDDLNGKEINQVNFNEVILKIKNRDSIATFNLYIKAFRKYMEFKKITLETPKSIKPNEYLAHHFTLKYLEDEIIPMVGLLFPKHSIKITTLFYFMFYTGLRKTDLRTLKRKNFDLVNRSAKVYEEKINRERIIRYPERVKKLLENYFALEAEEDNAFNLNDNSIDHYMEKIKPYMKDKILHCHCFRHSFAVHLLSKGVDLMTVSLLMGHKNIETTLRYLKLNQTEINNIYDSKIK